MRRGFRWLSTVMVLGLGACKSGEVAVVVELEVPDPEQPGAMRTQPLSDIEVVLHPFDRDEVFDSLSQAAATPEPQIPSEILEAQDSIAAAQERWQALDQQWNAMRDELATINSEIEGLARGERRYLELFRQFNDTEARLGQVDRQKQRAFSYFDSLSKANIERSNEIRIQIENWSDEAFADVDAVFLAKTRAAGREILADTTNAEGVATQYFRGLKGGTYWVHARYALPFSELYWNVPIEVVPGEPLVVRLNRGNAVERPKL